MRKQSEGDIPPRLVRLLDGITDRELATRMNDVVVAAGRCLERLGAINLVALEPSQSEEGSADLSVWETMAPAVGDTVVAINELCAVIDETFPPMSRQAILGVEGRDQRAEREAGFVFRCIGPLLRKEVAQVGALVRRPELVGSAWGLLIELQRLRSGLRQRVGDAVYLAAAALGPVARDEVVPGMQQEVRRALNFRATEAALRRTVAGRLAEPGPDGAALAKNVDEDLAVFTAMPPWRHIGIAARRLMLQAREQLRWLMRSGRTRPEQVGLVVAPLLEALSQASAELSRTVLAAHDQRARAEARLRAEQAMLHLELATGAASWTMEAALDAAGHLRGRSPGLDEVLRQATLLPVMELGPEALAPLVGQLARELDGLEA